MRNTGKTMYATPRPARVAAALSAVVAIGALDHLTGPDVGFALIYLVPVAATGWWQGRWAGVLVALAAAAAWLAADLAARGDALLLASAWNGLTRAVIFMAIAIMLDTLRLERDHIRQLEEHRTRALELLDSHLPRRVRTLAGAATALESGATDPAAVAREIRRAVQDLVVVTRDLVTLGLMPVGGPPAAARVDLTQLVREATRETDGGERVVVAAPLGPVVIRVDERRLRRAIIGALELATQRGTDPVPVHVAESEGWARLEIAGIDATAEESSADLAATVEAVGAKLHVADRILRLSLIRAAVEMHGGRITVGTGETLGLTLLLPLEPSARSR